MNKIGSAFAPANIALAKYWGKRDNNLNLPNTSSLSISLGKYGTYTEITESVDKDQYFLNNQVVDPHSEFYTRIHHFLDLYRPSSDFYFSVKTQSNIPVAAGVASSASGFAALTLALNQFFSWSLDEKSLSIMARLGSGSACRSLWQGFVEWNAGTDPRGIDSYAAPIESDWKELRIGLLLFNTEKKSVSSREAMKITVETSPLYKKWPSEVKNTLKKLHYAISHHDFSALGAAAEANAIAMHATMRAAAPSINYSQLETEETIKKITLLRKSGLEIYFTQDAGPNLKLLFLEKDQSKIATLFPEAILINPWEPLQ